MKNPISSHQLPSEKMTDKKNNDSEIPPAQIKPTDSETILQDSFLDKKSTKTKCSTCADSRENEFVLPFGDCSHYFCQDCIYSHFYQNDDSEQIKCFEPSCNAILKEDSPVYKIFSLQPQRKNIKVIRKAKSGPNDLATILEEKGEEMENGGNVNEWKKIM